jgi:hypothetical protein
VSKKERWEKEMRTCIACKRVLDENECGCGEYVGEGEWGTYCIPCHEKKKVLETMEEARDFVSLIHRAKILSDEEMLLLVKIMPFLAVRTSAIILSEAIQRVLKG